MSLTTKVADIEPLFNKPFNELTPAQKRMEIANDVIGQLELDKIRASHTYFNLEDEEEFFHENRKKGFYTDTLVKFFTKKKKKCNACAVGSMFISMCRIDGNFFIDSTQYMPEDSLFDTLGNFFDENQLLLIEHAFEEGDAGRLIDCLSWGDCDVSFDEAYAAEAFGEEYPYENKDRLIAIMQNIIDNEGEFRP